MKEESKSRVAVGVQEGVVRSRSRPAGILTVDAGGAAAEAKNQDELVWHELMNAQRTRKILSGPLSGIERLEGGWVVAVIYYKGCRVLIPMEEMMINLEGKTLIW